MAADPKQGKLSRGRIRVVLLRELALGGASMVSLGKRFGVSTMAISNFAERHAEEITLLRADLEDEWAGLWIADKRARIAELQQCAEDLQSTIEKVLLADGYLTAQIGLPAVKAVAAVYKQVAEELGQIPKLAPERFLNQPQPPTIVYEYPGVDPGTLV